MTQSKVQTNIPLTFFFKQEISAHEAGTALALGLVMSGKGPRDRS